MLTIDVILSETFNEETKRFTINKVTLELEHSLVSLSKWESEFEKPFLGKTDKTTEEVIAYIKYMIITPDFPPEVFLCLSQQNLIDIQAYIDAKRSATWFNDSGANKQGPARELITSELVYYWMTSYRIPWEAQYWHLNRLFTLIRVFNEKNEKKKPRGRAEIVAERQRLNAQRRAQYNTRG